MKTLKRLRFTQPSGTKIVLRELETPYYPPYSAERIVNGEKIEGWYGWSRKTVQSRMLDWEYFERKLQLEASNNEQ